MHGCFDDVFRAASGSSVDSGGERGVRLFRLLLPSPPSASVVACWQTRDSAGQLAAVGRRAASLQHEFVVEFQTGIVFDGEVVGLEDTVRSIRDFFVHPTAAAMTGCPWRRRPRFDDVTSFGGAKVAAGYFDIIEEFVKNVDGPLTYVTFHAVGQVIKNRLNSVTISVTYTRRAIDVHINYARRCRRFTYSVHLYRRTLVSTVNFLFYFKQIPFNPHIYCVDI